MRRTLAALGAAAAVAMPLSAQAQPSAEYTTFHPFWYRLAQAPEGCQGMGLLNLPAGWSPGDAAIVLVTASTLRDATRDPLVAGLLQEGAAVLEVATDAHPVCVAGGEAALVPRDAAGELAAVRRELVRYGAGLAVVIGYGPEGENVLRAVSDSAAAPEPRYAAGVAIANGTVRFALGPAPDEAERWPVRAGRLCMALALAVPSAGGDPAPCARALRERSAPRPAAFITRGTP